MKLKVDVNRESFERLRSATDLLVITRGDLQGPVLTRVAQEHRRQETRIFASEGAEGGGGTWPQLSPEYAKRKRRLRPGRRMLVWSGDLKDRFLKHSHPDNIETFQVTGPSQGAFLLGARSEIGGYHFRGNPNLPRRDMVTKTRAQVQSIWQAIVNWYRNERMPQVFRALRGSNPRRAA